MNRKNMLVETVRERRGTTFAVVEPSKVGASGLYCKIPARVPIGVFVGVNDNGVIKVGWSRCRQAPAFIPSEIVDRFRPEEKQAYLHAVRNSDKFNFERGITEACRNIVEPMVPPVHRGFARRFEKFKIRCQRYFKGATIGATIQPMIGRSSIGVNVGQIQKTETRFTHPSVVNHIIPFSKFNNFGKAGKDGPHGFGCRCDME